MADNVKIGAAVVGGYLLGRTKKAKLALGLGMFLAGKKLSLEPAQLVKMVKDSPVFEGLNTQVREELVEATKSAAKTAVTKRATGLAESLHERTLALDRSSGDSSGNERDDETGASDEGRHDAAEDDHGEQEIPAPRKRAAKSASAKATSAKTKATSQRNSSSVSGKTSQAARKRSSTARRAASGTRTSASEAKTRNGGGRGE